MPAVIRVKIRVRLAAYMLDEPLPRGSGDIAKQIEGLPDGSQIKLKITD
jgi:hypothetical protein